MDDITFINAFGEEETLNNPYNTNNIELKEEDIQEILNNLGIKLSKVINLEVFQVAMTHKSYVYKSNYTKEFIDRCKKMINSEVMELQKESYERLEYLGDAVLKLPIRHYLYTRYPNENEGYMTKLHIHIENKKSLAELAKSLNFGKYFVISKQIDNLGGRNMDRIHEDVFEAFLGALYLNGGFEICFEFIINLLETRIDYGEKLYQDVNYKDRLMKYYHQNNQEVPKYCYLHHYGPPYKRLYYMGVKKDNNGNDNIDNCFSFGYGSTKKQAEQNAAKMALILLKQLNDDQYNEQDIFYLTEKDIEKMKIEEENNNNNININI